MAVSLADFSTFLLALVNSNFSFAALFAEVTTPIIGKLADVNDKKIMTILKFLEYRDLIECKVASGGIKIKVLFNYHEGEPWIETADYNKAATQIRDYFRNKKS